MPNTTPLRVMVIESDPQESSRLTSMLNGLGWHVDYAASAKIARRIAFNREYDVVLLSATIADESALSLKGYLEAMPGIGSVVITHHGAISPNQIENEMVVDTSEFRHLVSVCQQQVSGSTLARSA